MLKPETIKQITEMLANATKEQREDFAMRHPVLNVEGRLLSGTNAMILTHLAVSEGCDTPTVVGGFQQWLKAGRSVRKGCKALYMRLPITYKRKEQSTGDAAAAQPADDATKPHGYKFVAVFDISQTEGVAA